MEGPIRTPGLMLDRFWRDESVDDEGWRWSSGYIDHRGICNFTAEALIIEGLLGFCGCGEPEVVGAYLRDVMLEIDNHVKSGFTKGYSNYSGERYLAWYVLDKAELTKHGGSVPGWLTDLGKDVLHDLLILYPINKA